MVSDINEPDNKALMPPERVVAFKFILALGLMILMRKWREILEEAGEDDMMRRLAVSVNSLSEAVLAQPTLQAPAERQALLALQRVQRTDQVTLPEDGFRLLDLVSSGVVNALVANKEGALPGFFANTGWWRGVPLPSAPRKPKKFSLALRRLTAFFGLIDLSLESLDATAAAFLSRPIVAALSTYEPAALADFLSIGQSDAVKAQVHAYLNVADVNKLTPERLAGLKHVFELGLKHGRNLDPSLSDASGPWAYFTHFVAAHDTAAGAPAQDAEDAAIAGAMVDALVQHRDGLLAGFIAGDELDGGKFAFEFVPPAERGKPHRHSHRLARRRVADFLNLTVTALTVDTENHDGDGAPALAGKIIDGLVLHEPAVLAAFLADDQPKTLRAQIAAAIPLWSEAGRAA